MLVDVRFIASKRNPDNNNNTPLLQADALGVSRNIHCHRRFLFVFAVADRMRRTWVSATPTASRPCSCCPEVCSGRVRVVRFRIPASEVVIHPPLGGPRFAGMSLYSGFWNTYGVCAGGFEGEKRGGV